MVLRETNGSTPGAGGKKSKVWGSQLVALNPARSPETLRRNGIILVTVYIFLFNVTINGVQTARTTDLLGVNPV